MRGDSVIYHADLNIGIAVAIDERASSSRSSRTPTRRTSSACSKTINDLGERARAKKLAPDDVQGGTFTITNPGVYGGLFGTPIINSRRSRSSASAAMKKRPVVSRTRRQRLHRASAR